MAEQFPRSPSHEKQGHGHRARGSMSQMDVGKDTASTWAPVPLGPTIWQ